MVTSWVNKGIHCKLWRGYVLFLFRIMWRDPVVEQHSLILTIDGMVYSHHTYQDETLTIRVITKLPNSEQSYKGKVKTQVYKQT